MNFSMNLGQMDGAFFRLALDSMSRWSPTALFGGQDRVMGSAHYQRKKCHGCKLE